MGNATNYVIGELRLFRASVEMSQEEFARKIDYSGSHVSGVETAGRAPTKEYMRTIDERFGTGGRFERMLRALGSLDADPAWLREWIVFEREATTLRWFELAYLPGLFQTERYARATLAGGRFTPEECDRIVTSRLGRQAVLTGPHPPQLIAVIDESVLRRPVLDAPGLMAEQFDRLVELAVLEHVQVHVVPVDAGMYLGLAGQFIIAELPDGSRVVHADNQLTAQIVEAPADVARLAKTWEIVRNEALPRRQSLKLIKEVAKSWN
ncbi:helix-turn-helix transcriptional regulator [Micromonospora sp. WMMD1128]|uniref:helix-turn-helix domain-containing protein n=1 Tax=unclassified Micromonospora TaxID=2617518 RepID=UPI00248CAB85|nr:MULTISPECIES: helix-turn-helix transcriptional regulator [unclassified Micromonospora]WBB76030.1 helix-turn-helix transcriptional regulator [Micromonospora sp. WMMD1128]WFE36186.1 helix-turn-helix transcriptional regulator [Micromonospora sp. WMMD975]